MTCADSRVAPELLFDEGLGLLFVIRYLTCAQKLRYEQVSNDVPYAASRMAGNVLDKASLGSIDYAVQHLKPSLLLVMGHQSCGAVKAGTLLSPIVHIEEHAILSLFLQLSKATVWRHRITSARSSARYFPPWRRPRMCVDLTRVKRGYRSCCSRSWPDELM